MKPIFRYYLVFTVIIAVILTACSNQEEAPAAAVEGYYQALAVKDKDALVNLSCIEWEQNALMELDSLAGVTAELKDMACQVTSTEGDDSLVNCTGEIVFNYNGELQAFPLSERVIMAHLEDNQWRVCGYK